jgi:RNA polymerase sigma factor (TIGR02999 family)
VLIDHARRHLAVKRGGSMRCVSLEEATEAAALQTLPDVDLLALEGALVELERLDPGKARTVELRFYAGLDLDEVAKVMGVSASTVTRQWRMARAWLFQRMHRR